MPSNQDRRLGRPNGRKSRLQELQTPILKARKRELLPLTIGYQEAKSRQGKKKIFIVRRHVGREEGFRKSTEVSKTEKSGARMKIKDTCGSRKNEEAYKQLIRRFGRYKRIRTEIIQTIQAGRAAGKIPGIFPDWERIRARILKGDRIQLWFGGN